MRADGHLAAAFEAQQEGPFRGHGGGGAGVVEELQLFEQFGVVPAQFDAERALADGRKHHRRVEFDGDPPLQAEAVEAGAGQDDGVVLAFVELAQAGVDVAAQVENRKIGPHGGQLGFTPQARGADPGAVRQGGHTGAVVGEKGVPRGFPGRNDADEQPLGQFGGHVLHRVDGKVHFAGEQRVLDFLDEQSLAADLGQRHVQDSVPLGGDLHQFNPHLRVGLFDLALNPGGLGDGQQAGAGADAQGCSHNPVPPQGRPVAGAEAVSGPTSSPGC